MTWVSTRALVEGKEPGYGAGSGGVAIFPCAAGLCSLLEKLIAFEVQILTHNGSFLNTLEISLKLRWELNDDPLDVF
jgi:hypothetical protein